jgi:hypothetical protein
MDTFGKGPWKLLLEISLHSSKNKRDLGYKHISPGEFRTLMYCAQNSSFLTRSTCTSCTKSQRKLMKWTRLITYIVCSCVKFTKASWGIAPENWFREITRSCNEIMLLNCIGYAPVSWLPLKFLKIDNKNTQEHINLLSVAITWFI